ncbi:hypothetical protein GCM10012280_40420 [Wenjunlia tyrosinilytica]|uniref:Uncharacterized protein n=1 Tax=Wenjunlia tyrosinilytica TaxID=1544741 RepID=A0A917ZU19_9ACTN|nr:hypothetical protein GCM10012280_40420 [Wenjunlia tyrosinilytica]
MFRHEDLRRVPFAVARLDQLPQARPICARCAHVKALALEGGTGAADGGGHEGLSIVPPVPGGLPRPPGGRGGSSL